MCHGSLGSDVWLKEQIARELLAEHERTEATTRAPEAQGVPSFLNEEREIDVELLTDGGDE